jgi:hypothetical protein
VKWQDRAPSRKQILARARDDVIVEARLTQASGDDDDPCATGPNAARPGENMTAGNPFLEGLARIPVADGVPYHSIIAVKGKGPVEEGNDGVVAYRSAHLDGATSELVVRSSHSTQSEPATVQEIRRILHLHGAELEAAGMSCGAPHGEMGPSS